MSTTPPSSPSSAPPPSGSAPAGAQAAIPTPVADAVVRQRARRKALGMLALVVVLVGAGWVLYDELVASHQEHTDNAYVQGNVVHITPQISGTVTAIYADDTDRVQAGMPLVQLDEADVQVAVQQAEAALAQTVRQVRALYANNATLAAQVQLRQAELARTRAELVRGQSEVQRTQQDVQRRQALVGKGAITEEELHHAQSQSTAARSQQQALRSQEHAALAAVVAAQEQLASNQTQTQGVALAEHPSVAAAAARLREALLAAQRTRLPAPVDGYVARRSVQVGQRVAAGAQLMGVVPVQGLWVDANFKENQLRNLRLGQPATLVADLYGKTVQYQGTVAGLGMGTGAAFALLPAQNATGNWIKVVQRVPVRIALDAQQLAQHPLRIGLSMNVVVDTSERGGPALAQAPRQQPLVQTQVYATPDAALEARIADTIARHAGSDHAVAMAPPSLTAAPAR